MDPLRKGRPEAAAVIWDPSRRPEAREAASTAPGRGRLIAQGLVGGGLALLLFRYWSELVGVIVLAISALFLLAGLVSPGGLGRALLSLFERLGVATGKALTWILLGFVFCLFFVPFGRLFRSGRRDRLRRYMDPDAPTYWENPEGMTAASSSRQAQY